MTCKLCQSRPVPESYGSPRKCAFDESGAFTSDNWNCETMNALRGALLFRYLDDDNGSIALFPLIDGPNDVSGYIVLTYYKSRGTIGGARIVNDDQPDIGLTLEIAESQLEQMGVTK